MLVTGDSQIVFVFVIMADYGPTSKRILVTTQLMTQQSLQKFNHALFSIQIQHDDSMLPIDY